MHNQAAGKRRRLLLSPGTARLHATRLGGFWALRRKASGGSGLSSRAHSQVGGSRACGQPRVHGAMHKIEEDLAGSSRGLMGQGQYKGLVCMGGGTSCSL